MKATIIKLNKWIFNLDSTRVWLLIAIPSVLITAVLDLLFWNDFALSNGEEVLAIYIPPFVSVLYSLICFYKAERFPRLLLNTFLLFLVLSIPILKHAGDQFYYQQGNDSELYYKAADYMYRHKTLCSYDNKILGVELGNHYLFQPGNKYYLAGLLFLNNGVLERWLQFLGNLIICAGLIGTISSIISVHLNNKFKNLLILFLIGICPAMVKNNLMGGTEWLTICTLLASVYFVSRNKSTAALLFLSLSVFIRQTSLPLVLVGAALIILYQSKRKITDALVFLAILFIPVYHNLYYAGTARFFADYSWWAPRMEMTPSEYFKYSMLTPYPKSILQYFAIDIEHYSFINLIMAILFLPTAWVMTFKIYKFYYLESIFWFCLLGITIGIMTWPSFAYNGSAYFPRFQLFNFSAVLVLFLIWIKCVSNGKAKTIIE